MIVFCLLCTHHVFAQNKYVDSLINWLQTHPEQDTSRVMMTHRLAYRLSEIDPSKAWIYAKQSEELATKIGFIKGISLSNINYAILETNEGNYENSAKYYMKAIEFAEKINFVRGKSISYNNIGDNYLKLKNYDKVLEYSNIALKLNEKIDEKRGQAINKEQIGQVYYLKKEYDKAFKSWNESILLMKGIDDLNMDITLSIDIAKFYLAKNDIKTAFEYLNSADSLATSSNELLLKIKACKAFSDGYEKKQLYDSAISYLKKALQLSLILGEKSEENDIYNLIANHFEKIKKYDSAYYYLRKHKNLSDTVLSDKNFAHLTFIQTQHETEIKEKENQRLRTIQFDQSKKISEKNALLIASIIALFFAILSSFLIFRSAQNKKKQQRLEEEKKDSKYNQQLAEMEIKTLRSQMNPHFLFNSLNSIRNFIIKNEPQKASNYLANFASLMRKILDSSQQSKILLQEEIEMLKLYIDLELLRFSNKFTFQIDVDKDIQIDDVDIPSMVLQPFVENAIWHGLLNIEDNAHLTIRFKKIVNNEDELLCEIEDNGIGRAQNKMMKNSLKKHKSKGIDITKERLKKLSHFPENEQIEIIDLQNSNGNARGTLVKIYLPIL